MCCPLRSHMEAVRSTGVAMYQDHSRTTEIPWLYKLLLVGHPELPHLSLSDPSLAFVVVVDTSEVGVGAMLS